MSTWGAGPVPTFKFEHVEQGQVHAFKVLRASLTTKSNSEKQQHPKYTSHQTEEIPQKVWHRCATQHPTAKQLHLPCLHLRIKHQLQGHRLLLVAADDLKEALLPKAFVILARVAPRRDVCFDTTSHDEREGESAPTPLFPRRRACPWRSAS